MRFATFVIILFLFAGCKKYPDGGHVITIKGLNNKILGKWKINGFTVNGTDSLNVMQADPDFCDHYQLEFSHDDIFGNTISSPCRHFGNNYWGVSDNKSQLEMFFHADSSAVELYPVQLNEFETVMWDIRRVTRNELWLQTDFRGKEYEVKLERYDQ